MTVRKILTAAVAVALLVSSLGGLSPAPAHACSCAPPNLAEAIAHSPAIFLGTGEVLREVLPGTYEVRIRVDTVWKGDIAGDVTVMTDDWRGGCGYSFGPGRHLVFAYERDGQLWVSGCSSSRPIDGPPPPELGSGRQIAPMPASPPAAPEHAAGEPQGGRNWTPWAAGGAGLALLAATAGAGIAWRQRRR